MSILFVNGRQMPQTNISNEKTFIARECYAVCCVCVVTVTVFYQYDMAQQ